MRILIRITLVFLLWYPLLGCNHHPRTQISVMTFNIENGGTQVDFNQVVAAIKKAGADIVGIQEPWGHTQKLARALGWNYAAPDQHIISRFPLYEARDKKGRFLYVEVLPDKFIAVANMHLPDADYGLDLIQEGASVREVLAREKAQRLTVAEPYIRALAALAQQQVPVFLTGDFNSASHLNWTQETVGKLPGHAYAVQWPVTKNIEYAGLIDSFRARHPDPLKNPGFTWPAGRPFLTKSMDGYNPSQQDLSVRIDFVFTGGPSKTLDSQIVGEAQYYESAIKMPQWVSDHRALVSRFKVLPAAIPKDQRVLVSSSISGTQPSISVANNAIPSGAPVVIRWHNAPGNRYDYIKIRAKDRPDEEVRLYTHAKKSGAFQYDQKLHNHHWLPWGGKEAGRWPLRAGVYDVQLMEDDGTHVLASTHILVVE